MKIRIPDYRNKRNILICVLVLTVAALSAVLIYEGGRAARELEAYCREMTAVCAKLPGLKLETITRNHAEFQYAGGTVSYEKEKNFVLLKNQTLPMQELVAALKSLKDLSFDGRIADCRTGEGLLTADFSFRNGTLSGTLAVTSEPLNSKCAGKFSLTHEGELTLSDTTLVIFDHISFLFRNLVLRDFYGKSEQLAAASGMIRLPEWKTDSNNQVFKNIRIDDLTYHPESEKWTGLEECEWNGGGLAGTVEADKNLLLTAQLKSKSPDTVFTAEDGSTFREPELKFTYDLFNLRFFGITEKSPLQFELFCTDYKGKDGTAAVMLKKYTEKGETERTYSNFASPENNTACRISASEVRLTAGDMAEMKNASFSIPSKGFTLSDGTLTGGNFSFPVLTAGKFFTGAVSGRYDGDGRFSGNVTSKIFGKGTFSGQYREQGAPELLLALPAFDWKNVPLQTVMPDLPDGTEMTGSGSLTCSGGKLVLSGKNCTLTLPDIFRMTGLDFSLALKQGDTEPGQHFTFKTLTMGGFTFTNGAVSFRKEKDQTILESAAFDWCGGRITLSPGSLAPETLFTADCAGLVLAEFLTQCGLGKFSGEGRISGKLPFRLTKNGIMFDKESMLYSLPGSDSVLKGSLQSVTQTGGNAADLGFAYEMMENMQYRWVSIKLGSAEDGLSVKLGMRFNASPGREMMYEPDLVNGGIRKSAKPTRLGYLLLNLDEITLEPEFLRKAAMLKQAR